MIGDDHIGLTSKVTEQSSEHSVNKRRTRQPVVIPGADTWLTRLYARQINAYYGLPQKRYPKRSLTFSPSSAGECSRRLYYELVNAETDPDVPQIPWQSRVPRVGDGLHIVNQEDAKRMPTVLSENGVQPTFRVKTLDNGHPAIETVYEKTFHVDDVDVNIRGRVDAVIQFVDENGEVTDEAVLDYKIKTTLKKLAPSSIVREIEKYRPQMICYSLLTGIDNILIEFESSQKPDWSDGADAKPDERYVHIVPTDEERQTVLNKFAEIIRCIRDGRIPPHAECHSCRFCPYKNRCAMDGDC